MVFHIRVTWAVTKSSHDLTELLYTKLFHLNPTDAATTAKLNRVCKFNWLQTSRWPSKVLEKPNAFTAWDIDWNRLIISFSQTPVNRRNDVCAAATGAASTTTHTKLSYSCVVYAWRSVTYADVIICGAGRNRMSGIGNMLIRKRLAEISLLLTIS